MKTLRYRGETYTGRVFSLPDVQVGSILEYSYILAYDDNQVLPARWYLQHDAPALHEHYHFKPMDLTGNRYVNLDHGQTSRGLYYVTYLPKGAGITTRAVGQSSYDLTVDNIPALPQEEYLPPIDSFSYRVLFYYAAELNSAAYWAAEGRFFSKDVNHFAEAGAKMRTDVAALVSPADSPEIKARKLYAAVMKIDNTNYDREHSAEEDKEDGLHPIRNAEDVWERQRGYNDQVAMAYIAMLRQVGITAYGMRVTNRDRNIFEPEYTDMSQLDDTIVIAVLDGKEVFLDPGARYCPFGELSWHHSSATGIRQSEHGSEIAQAAGLDYKDTRLQRIAVLGLGTDGVVGGTVRLTWTGQGATAIRESEIGAAAADTKQRLEDTMRGMLPGGMSLHMISVENLTDGEKPLSAVFAVSGPAGTVTGHRLLIAEDLLRGDEKERFASPTRRNAVYFRYPYAATDYVQLQLDPGLKLEALPQTQNSLVLGAFAYTVEATSKGDIVTAKRSVAMGAMLVPVPDYTKIRTFFGDLRSADQNQLLFLRTPVAASSQGSAGAASAPAK
jgi:transglutaminase-like putative cysteine protease